mgnify:CR=1 FL=1
MAEEPAQTNGFSVKDHLDVVRHYGGASSVDAVLANNNRPDAPTPAGLDFIATGGDWNDASLLLESDVLDEVSTARHDSAKLAHSLAEAYRKHRGTRRRLPRIRLDFRFNRTADDRTIDT